MASFSQEVREEILSSRLKNKCCRRSQLCGMLFGGIRDTDAVSVAKLGKEFPDIENPDPSCIFCTSCGWAFVRGLFVSCGTVASPESAYHLEMVVDGQEKAQKAASVLAENGYIPGFAKRRGGQIGLYFKDSEQIFDILNYIGASKSAFKVIDAKIYRELRNNVNRVSNCELANISKTVKAAEGQLAAIEAIIESGRADELSEELKETLDLRAAFPDISLSELSEKHNPPLTRSGLNHRLKKLVEFSKKCRK